VNDIGAVRRGGLGIHYRTLKPQSRSENSSSLTVKPDTYPCLVAVSGGVLLRNHAQKRFVDFPFPGFPVILGIAARIAGMMHLLRVLAHGPGAIQGNLRL